MDNNIFKPSNNNGPLILQGTQKKRSSIKLLPEDPKKKKLAIVGIILGLIILIGGVWFFLKPEPKKAEAPVPAAKTAEPAKPTTEASRLSGIQISPEANKKHITSIQIENSPDARPQSGLKDASVIYEAVAEGGITRFNASFLETAPDYIGPVRSVRPYYVDFVAPFDPVFVHAGGSADGLAQLRNVGLKDMDHGANGGAFMRVADRYAPHNLYTTMQKLDQASASRGYTTSNATGFARKAKESPSTTPNAKAINLNLSSFLYNVQYNYDAASNSYLRTMAGKPHTDLRSGTQLAPKVVIAIVTDYSQRGIYSVYRTTGSGKVYIFQDGISTEGTWTKNSVKEQYVFTDSAGKKIELNPGQTWISLVGTPAAVAVTP